jgi:hypothetical protein
LNDPDRFLLKLVAKPFLFRLPEARVSLRMAYLIDPVFFSEESAGRTQPCAFRLALSCPAAKSAKDAGVKGNVFFSPKKPARIVALGQQDLGNKRHTPSRDFQDDPSHFYYYGEA